MQKEIILNGNSFSSLKEFYDEVERKFTQGLDWKIGRNLDAFNDVLRGGFGVHEYQEEIVIRWKFSEKSKSDLGKSQTTRYLKEKLERCHPSNRAHVQDELRAVNSGKGLFLFDTLVGIIQQHEHITLRLE